MIELLPGVLIDAATPLHARLVAAKLRPADVEELRAAGVEGDLADHLAADVEHDSMAWVAWLNHELAVIFGAVPAPDESYAVIWALGTDAVDRHPLLFIAAADEVLRQLLGRFPVLSNLVHNRNTRAVRWLKYAGAQFSEPVTLPNGEVFIPFHLTRS